MVALRLFFLEYATPVAVQAMHVKLNLVEAAQQLDHFQFVGVNDLSLRMMWTVWMMLVGFVLVIAFVLLLLLDAWVVKKTDCTGDFDFVFVCDVVGELNSGCESVCVCDGLSGLVFTRPNLTRKLCNLSSITANGTFVDDVSSRFVVPIAVSDSMSVDCVSLLVL